MTFARLTRLLAILLVAFALWRMRPPAEPPRVAVLALPGATQDVAFASAGRDSGDTGQIRIPADTSGAFFWRHLVAVSGPDGADAAPRPPLWAGERAPVRVLGAPVRLFVDRAHQDVDGHFFLGSSSGAIVEAADITSGRLPFPYDRAVDAVASAVASLGRDHWSEWIAVPAAPGSAPDAGAAVAEFQFARYTDTSYYFSPAYVRAADDVVADAFLRGLDRELRPTIATHVIGLARRRLPSARALFPAGGDHRPVIVFEDVAEDASKVFAPDSTPSSVGEQIRAVVAEALAAIRESVGKDGIVLVVGGPATTRQTGAGAWYRVVRGGGGGAESAPTVDLAAAASTLRYLAGVALDPSDRKLVPAALVSRYPVRATAAVPSSSVADEPPAREWTASTLESVPGAVTGN